MINIGDLVRIKGKGNHGGWVTSMDDMVGKVYTVTAVSPVGYLVDGFCFSEDEIELVNSEERREVVRFFSERQIEEYFAPRLAGETEDGIRRWLERYCESNKVKCCGIVYTAEDLVRLLT